MYKAFFGLAENPFSLSPNPKYCYMSERHTEALAHLSYGLQEGGGFVLLTGEVGTGKTTVSRCLRRQLDDETQLAVLHNPTLGPLELLQSLCDELQLAYDPEAGLKGLFDLLKGRLQENQAAGRRTVLLIDEAQHLTPEVLEQLRLLTNLETDDAKLLQVVLIGQPELQQLLQQPLLRQLAQRITARYHLLPLSRADVDAYVRFRLQVAGCLQPLFTPSAIAVLHRVSGGIPRLINLICERALLGAYGAGSPRITPKLVRQAAEEALGYGQRSSSAPGLLFALCGAAFLAAGWFGWQQWGWEPTAPVEEVTVTVKQPVDAELVSRFQGAWQLASEESSALQQLYRVWGYEVMPDEADCSQAYRADLRCELGVGTLDDLLALDHPAVVRLVDEDGLASYATLLQVEGQQADLLLGDESWRVDLSWLKQMWGDDYTLLWAVPAGSGGVISAKSRGPAVQWLETALSQALNEPVRTLRRFDSTLEDRLRRFQQQEGLAVDGVAGPQTLIRLNARSQMSMPRLVLRQDSPTKQGES